MSSHSTIALRSSWALVTIITVALLAGFAVQKVAYANDGLTAGASTVTTVPGTDGDADNMKNEANVYSVFRYGWQDGRVYFDRKSTVKTLDITGDTYPDTIKVTSTKPSSNSAFLNKIKVSIEGKTVKTVKFSNIDRAAVSVITLKNNEPYLWIATARSNSKVQQTLYHYEKGKLKKVFSNSDLSKKNTSNCYISSIDPSGNSLNVTYTLVTSVTGLTKATYTYKYKNGAMSRTSDTTSKIKYATTDTGYFTKSKLSSAGKFTAFTDIYLDEKAFTVNVKKKVQPVSITLMGNKLYYKIKYGSKTGWIACPKIKRESKHSPYTMFYETYGKVKLKTSIPTYSRSKYYKASDLQLYSDHSLLIARNWIYARSGHTFSTPELKKYFKSKSWYKADRLRPYTDQDKANIELIIAIEENRGSLYI